ncbi:hypothetical protein JHK87_006867 [Glycine soja]|nr:hypothetical protein JHK87_006867 [Glycine soja]
MKSLCEIHNDIWTLMTALELPVSDWEDKWIDVYLDISSKLLDICNAFSSELSCLNQGNLPLKCALHNLDSASSKQYLQACSLLDDWRQHVSSRNPRIEKCSSMLDNLVGSLDLPKVKNSAKGKVLMQAMYGVKVETAGVDTIETEWLVKTVEELRASAEKLSQGIDLLAKGVDEFFQAVMTSRDTLLSSVRFDKTVNDPSPGLENSTYSACSINALVVHLYSWSTQSYSKLKRGQNIHESSNETKTNHVARFPLSKHDIADMLSGSPSHVCEKRSTSKQTHRESE